jgi:hypothetical protein
MKEVSRGRRLRGTQAMSLAWDWGFNVKVLASAGIMFYLGRLGFGTRFFFFPFPFLSFFSSLMLGFLVDWFSFLASL